MECCLCSTFLLILGKKQVTSVNLQALTCNFSTTRSRCCPFTDLQDLNCIFMGGGTWAEQAGSKILKTHSCSHVQLSRVMSEKVQAWCACVKTAKFIMKLDRLWCKLQPDWLVNRATLETSKTEWNYLL